MQIENLVQGHYSKPYSRFSIHLAIKLLHNSFRFNCRVNLPLFHVWKARKFTSIAKASPYHQFCGLGKMATLILFTLENSFNWKAYLSDFSRKTKHDEESSEFVESLKSIRWIMVMVKRYGFAIHSKFTWFNAFLQNIYTWQSSLCTGEPVEP